MRSFDGRKQEQDDLHTGGIIKGLGMKSHLHSPKSNSKRQVCINNATFSSASEKKTLQAQELHPKKKPWHFNVIFCSIPPAYVFQHVEQAYRTLFFVPLHTLPKITMQIRDTTVVNHQSTRKQTTTTLSPLPSHPYQVVPAHAGKLPPSLIL